jgi:hypothetical protein
MNNRVLFVDSSADLNKRSPKLVKYIEQSHPIYLEKPINQEEHNVFNKSLFGVISLLIIIKLKLFTKINPKFSNLPIQETISPKQIPTYYTDWSSLYFIIAGSSFFLFLGMLILIFIYPIFKAYTVFSNTKTFLFTITNNTIFNINKLISTIQCITFSLLNPHLSSGEELKKVQNLLVNKQETMQYMMKAVALRKLAFKYNITLTDNNNNSFIVLPNKSLVIDPWMTNHIHEVIVDKIAYLLTKKNETNYTFLPVVHAFNITLFNNIKTQINLQLNEILVFDENIPHYPLKLLNNTVLFFNKTTIKNLAASSVVFIFNRPIAKITNNWIKNRLISLSRFSIASHPLLKFKDRLIFLIPSPIKKLQTFITSHLPKPSTELELVKKNLLAAIPKQYSFSRFWVNIVLSFIPNSYIEAISFLFFYFLVKRYIQSFLNKAAVYVIKRITDDLEERWNNTEIGQEAIALFYLNYNNSLSNTNNFINYDMDKN